MGLHAAMDDHFFVKYIIEYRVETHSYYQSLLVMIPRIMHCLGLGLWSCEFDPGTYPRRCRMICHICDLPAGLLISLTPN